MSRQREKFSIKKHQISINEHTCTDYCQKSAAAASICQQRHTA
jgi:hypothetical protein